MLAPALVLVVIVLGAIAIDLSLVHTARRSAYRSLSAAVDDAASMIDSREFQLSGDVQLDEAAAERVVYAHLGLLDGDAPAGFAEPAFEVLTATVEVDVPNSTVRIHATIEVDHVLLTAVPAMGDSTQFEMDVAGRMF